MSGPVNVFDVELKFDPDEPEGYCRRWAQLGPLVAGEKLGMSVYLLEDAEWICAYHYEWGAEEWLIVLDGTPTLRTPEGEHALEPGDVVCFREGPEGAHNVRGPGRVAMLSTKRPVGIDGVSGQRQDRLLGARRQRLHAAANAEPRLLGRRALAGGSGRASSPVGTVPQRVRLGHDRLRRGRWPADRGQSPVTSLSAMAFVTRA